MLASRLATPLPQTKSVVPAIAEVSKPSEVQKPPVVSTPQPEIPTVTVSEVKKPVVPTAPAPPRDLGRGGAQHKAIQQRIKQAAEALGFRSTIEQAINGSKQGIDLSLERSDITIACEISLSTTVDHEVGNVAKCIKAGYGKVAVICLDDKRLQAIAAAVAGSLGSEVAQRVTYAQPDEFIASLQSLPPPANQTNSMRRGYVVRRTLPESTPVERRQKEEIALRAISEAMRKKP